MKLNNKKGFTLIELLVVVAIIGILATVVLAALGSARIKAKDAAVLSTMNSMHRQVELDYDGTYTTLCTDTGSVYDKFEEAVETHGGEIDSCDATTNDYRLVATLPSSLASIPGVVYAGPAKKGFCVNSLGTAQRVIVSDIEEIASPACNAGEVVAGVFTQYCTACSSCIERNTSTGVEVGTIGSWGQASSQPECNGAPQCNPGPESCL